MQFFTIAFSTFLGAAVALAAERMTRAYDAKLQEEAAINNLILDLAAKRAFLVGEDWVWGDGELRRVTDSIFNARTLIRDARLALRPRSPALSHLLRMVRACNAFIEQSERETEEHLKGALKALSREMTSEVHALHHLRPNRILADAPGSSALHSPIS
jgi:hypothetical protein